MSTHTLLWGRAMAVALTMGLALAQPSQGQSRYALQVVGDDWRPDALNIDNGRNYGVGLREMGGDSYVRPFWSLDMMIYHNGPGSLLFVAVDAGGTFGPRGETGFRPYGLAAIGCLCFFGGGGGLSPLVGAGLELPVSSHHAFVEFQYYTRRKIRSTLTVGMYF